MKVIFDASALLETLDPNSPVGPLAGDVRIRATAHVVTAPALLVWELGNRLVRPMAGKPFEAAAELALRVAQLTEDMELDLPSADAVARTIQLAIRHSLTFYDASYLELAQREADSILISQDEVLRLAAAKELGTKRAVDVSGADRTLAR